MPADLHCPASCRCIQEIATLLGCKELNGHVGGDSCMEGVGSKNFNSLVCEEDCVEGAVLAGYVVLCNSILLLQDNYRHSGFSITMYQCQWEHL